MLPSLSPPPSLHLPFKHIKHTLLLLSALINHAGGAKWRDLHFLLLYSHTGGGALYTLIKTNAPQPQPVGLI